MSKIINFIKLPVKFFQKLEELNKKQQCVVSKDVQLYPQCRIENCQNKKKAIIIDSHCRIKGQLLVLKHGGQIKIGQYTFIGEGSRIWSGISVKIGNRVLISHNVGIYDTNTHSISAESRHQHCINIISSGQPSVLEDVLEMPVIIKDDAWIGSNATIMKGITIGRGAIVGACSVVFNNVEPYSIVAGNPAKVIGKARE